MTAALRPTLSPHLGGSVVTAPLEALHDVDRYGNPIKAKSELCVAVSTSAIFAADFFSSWVGYISALLIAHPLDTLRIRWQTRYHSPLYTLRNDSLRSLYAGLATPILANGPLTAGIFATNELYRAMFRWVNIHVLGRKHLEHQQHFTVPELALAGLFAGASMSLLQCPASVIRIQQQVGGGGTHAAPSILTVGRQLWATEGVAGFYRALPIEAASSGIGRMTYFTTYEMTKGLLARTFPESNATARMCFAASLTSIIGWASCFPLDVMKNRLQADAIADPAMKQYRGFRHCCEVTYRTGGIRAFWTGFSLTIARSVISSGISLPVFDTLKPKMRAAVPRCPSVAAS
jgi:solute carrier family 25 carnitine/acylcarnitine transporter 20/29